MNRTPKAQIDRDAALQEAKRKGDFLTLSMIEADLVDFDPQPVYVPRLCSEGHKIDPMCGCACNLGDDD